MTCSPPIFIVPGGCLGKEVMELACKSPLEVKDYSFTVSNRLSPIEEINYVIGQPSGNSGVSVNEVEIDGQTFKCKIKGGFLNKNVGIRFVVHTKLGNIIEFDCKLPIRPAGVLYNDGCQSIILDPSSPAGTITVGKVEQVSSDKPATVTNIGTPEAAIFDFEIPQGDEGKAATIEIGEVKTGESGSKADVVNSGTSSNAILNITLPTGKDGEVQTVKIGKTTTLPAGQDATVVATTKNDVVTLDFGIPSGTTGEAGQYILNIGEITTLAPDQQATATITSDGKGNHSLNLGIPQGKSGNDGKDGENGRNGIDGISPTISIGTVSTLDPSQKATAEINHGANGRDTLNLGLVKGDQGESYVNNGTVDLNVKSITSDSGALKSGRNGTLSLNSLEVGNSNNSGAFGYIDFHLGNPLQQLDYDVREQIKTIGTPTITGQGYLDYVAQFLQASGFGLNNRTTLPITVGKTIIQYNGAIGIYDQATTKFTPIPLDTVAGSSLKFLQGKKVSIYGDSISTYTGYIPSDGRPKASYPASDVTDVSKTWWMQIITKTGAILGVNDSWSGSCVTGDPDTDKSCLGYRIKNKSIPADTDLCLILSGINDLRTQKTLGTFNGLKKQADLDFNTFADCVSNVMYLAAQNYPNTNFVWVTPLGDFTWPSGFPEYVTNPQDRTYPDYCNVIKDAAYFYGYKCIDMHNYFSFLRVADFLDGIHPKAAGMTRTANALLNNITNILG